MKSLYWICLILIIVGAINWGLVGLFNFDLVAFIFGSMSKISRLIYTIVGFAALVMIYVKFNIK